jgi:predicted alpha/beta-hydrolase family hydrolase
MKNSIYAGMILALAALPSNAEEIKLPFRGLTINANLNLAEGKSIENGIVLLVHGSFAHKDMEGIALLQDGLLERGFSSLNINLSYSTDDRHGMFGCENVQDRLDSEGVKEIGVWTDWLRAQGATRIILFGHSRGGNHAARYIADTKDTTIVAAVMAAPGTGSVNSAENYKARHKTELKPILEKAVSLVDAGKGETLMKGVGFLFCANTTVTAATFVDNYVEHPDRDTPTVVQRIEIPVMVAVGTADTVATGLAPAMREITKDNVNFVEIEDAGHFFIDFFGEDLLDVAEEFITANGF